MTRLPPLSTALLPLFFLAATVACGDKVSPDTTGTADTTDNDGDGYPSDVDCDDSDAAVSPGAAELCNELDDDCDGVVDNDPVDGLSFYADSDGDGFGNPAYETTACSQPDGWVSDATDCSDLSAAAHPGGTEVCDELDNDCDGNVDESVDDAPTWYVDADGDGFGNAAVPVQACTVPDVYVDNADDCDDSNAALSPLTIWYGDVDGDGFGGTDFTAVGCEQPADHLAVGDDCDDRDAAVNPDAEEICDDLDNDCNGTVDGADATDALTFYEDADGDGYGVGDGASTVACSAPDGYAEAIEDCNDTDATVSPGALEQCDDGLDNDCDGGVDIWCEQDLSAADIFIEGVTASDYSGYRLSSAGDINGDGQTDLAIGAYGADGAGSLAGQTYLLLGPLTSGATLSLADAVATISGAASNDYSGAAIHLGGDATGDGTDDLSIGAWGVDTGTSGVGGAYLFSGPVTGALSVDDADFSVTGNNSLDYMAQYTVLSGPDLTGDGQGDFLAGVVGDDAGGTSAGVITVYAGPLSGSSDSDSASLRIQGATSGSYIGYSLACGDIDGDGLDDILVGATGLSTAYALYGPLTGTVSADDADVTVLSSASDGTGSQVALGDFDGDGAQDLALGGKYYGTDTMSNAGIWRVMAAPLASSLPASLSTDDAVFSVSESSSSEYFGAQYTQVATGDLNGDAVDDLAVGAPTNDLAGSTAGAAFIFVGPLSGSITVEQASLTLYGEDAGTAAGYGLDLGDLDGDGSLDVIVGARGWGSSAGRTYVVTAPDL